MKNENNYEEALEELESPTIKIQPYLDDIEKELMKLKNKSKG